MLPRRPLARALTALVFAASSLTTAGPALAKDPPQPLPGYRPDFVTEREPGVWEDCTWAAAAMLLDKWTNGTTNVTRQRLRKLSGDLEGGSNLFDVQRAFGKLGFKLRASPLGGESTTWPELLDRLARGGGAVLAGDYGKLPRHYGRWAPETWNNTGVDDDHAFYLDAYDAKRGSILVMDPLAPAGWGGEWIPVKALKKFAWRGANGALWVAMTPPAVVSPFVGVGFGEPTVSADSSELRVSWPLEATPTGWKYPGATVTATVEAVTEAGPGDLVIGALPALEHATAPAPAPAAVLLEAELVASLPLPPMPGIYRVVVTVNDNRLNRPVATSGPFSLFVPGPRAARFGMPEAMSVEAGGLAEISFWVANAGTVSWADPRLDSRGAYDFDLQRNTRLVGTWVLVAPPEGPSPEATAPVPAGPASVTDPVSVPDEAQVPLGPAPLEQTFTQRVDAILEVPTLPGTWRFVVDVVDEQGGSFALSGSAPGILTVEVSAPLLDANLE